MSYLNVISLVEAKTFLRIDDGNTDDDAQIMAMINSAGQYVEQKTNHRLIPTSITFNVDSCGQVRVYDYPITASTTDFESTIKTDSYQVFEPKTSDIESGVWFVGYQDPADIPEPIRTFMLNYVKVMYYDSQSNDNMRGHVPIWLEMMIEPYRRFIL